MELALTRPNLKAALKRVRKNKGGPGIDGMTTEELLPYLWKGKDAVSWWTWTWRRFSKAQCVTSTSRTARCETRMPGGVAGAAGVTRPPYADPRGAVCQSSRLRNRKAATVRIAVPMARSVTASGHKTDRPEPRRKTPRMMSAYR